MGWACLRSVRTNRGAPGTGTAPGPGPVFNPGHQEKPRIRTLGGVLCFTQLCASGSISHSFVPGRVCTVKRSMPVERTSFGSWSWDGAAMGVEHGLSQAQLEFYESEGYLVIPDYASAAECATLLKRLQELLRDFDPSTISIFSTTKQRQYIDKYFYESANNISFFFEEKAFDENRVLKQPKELSINKVGHAMHDLDPDFRKFSRSEKVAAIAASLGYKRPAPIQSMAIFKQPGIGGEVVPHQDNTFMVTDPPSLLGFWWPLEDATKENGCLWVIPKSHKDGLKRKFLKEGDSVRYDRESPEYDRSAFIPVEMKAGSLILLHGDLVHQSYENASPKARPAYSIHLVETDGVTYAETNWLQRRPDFPPEPLFENKAPLQTAV